MKKICWLGLCLCAALLLSACVASPKGGADFSGPIDINPEKAQNARLSFGVSGNSTRIEYVRLEMSGLNCAAMRAESSDYYHIQDVKIRNGRFTIEDPGIGLVKGRFISSTRARGTIQIKYNPDEGGALTNFTLLKRDVPCDLGAWDWEAGL